MKISLLWPRSLSPSAAGKGSFLGRVRPSVGWGIGNDPARIFLSAISVVAFAVLCAYPAELEWKAGLASVKITPERPVPMAGYAGRTKPFERVEQDIYAKALALEDRLGNRAVLVTTDLIGIPRAVAEPVCQRIQGKTKLDRSQILLSSSHVHSAPMLSFEKRTEAGVAPEDARNLVAFTQSLQDKLVDVAVEALSRLEPARLAWGSGVAHFAMNRREFTTKGVVLGVNPRGLVDRSVPVLRVDSADGKLRAVLFQYACHNTTLTQTNFSLCGDYAGFAQAYIQERFPGVQAMFMIGCAGDANPYPRGTMENARELGATLGQEVGRILEAPLQPVSGPLNCVFEHANVPLQQFSRAELVKLTKGPSWQSGNAKAMLARLDNDEKLASIFPAPVAVWQFGRDLTLVGLSGEVVVDYVPLVQRAIGPLQLWIAGYCNDVFGYFPSARVLKEGGYECRGLYTTEGFFASTAQEVLVAKVRELALRAGRKPGE
jgi:neutral ceramidase